MFTRVRYIPSIEIQAAVVSLVTGITLLGVKFTAYYFTGSSAVFSDAVESIVNVMASAVALWALSVAHTPPDEEHPYGHGKIEFLAAGFEGGMILLASVFITWHALDQLLFRQLSVDELDLGLLLIMAATLINGMVGIGLIRIGKKQQSLTLQADGMHLITDAVTSVSVLIALLLVHITKLRWMDPAVGILIGLYVAWSGIRLMREAASGLMDEQDQQDEKILIEILNSHTGKDGKNPKICSFHKLRHRHSGRYHWVDFHMVVPRTMSIQDGHRIASSIENEIEKILGEGDATAHIEPCIDPECSICEGTLIHASSKHV